MLQPRTGLGMLTSVALGPKHHSWSSSLLICIWLSDYGSVTLVAGQVYLLKHDPRRCRGVPE